MTTEHKTIRVRLSYPIDRVKEPVLYHLILDFGLIPNIHRANIDVHTGGFIVLDLSGEPDKLDKGVQWMQSLGVTVKTVVSDGVEEGLD